MENIEFWASRWDKETQRWNIGAPHPFMPRLLELINIHTNHQAKNVFVPGCGHAHDAAFLANAGFAVIAEDFVPKAIEAAKLLYNDTKNLNFNVADVLKVEEAQAYFFDCIYDRAMCNALAENIRIEYIASCEKRLKKGGLFVAILMTKVGDEKDPPPYPLPSAKMIEHMGSRFELVFREERTDGVCDNMILSEAIEVWRKL